MKFALISLCSLVVPFLQGYGQLMTIREAHPNTFYFGAHNQVAVSLPEYPLDSISITTSNGDIRENYRRDYKIFYLIEHEKVGNLVIKTRGYYQSTLLFVDKMDFNVVRLPASIRFGNETEGTLSKSRFCAQVALMAEIDCELCPDGVFHINSYTVVVLRGNKKMFIKKIQGSGRIDAETSKFFETLQNGDKVFFRDITFRDWDGFERHAEDNLRFTINREEEWLEHLKNKGKKRIIVDPNTGEEVEVTE